MTPAGRWPGLAGVEGVNPIVLHFERGVHGKVHGQRSDFRWIAATAGLQPVSNALTYELVLGSQDEPARAVYWKRTRRGSHCAVVGYRSRAYDAAGRSGFLELQVLEWTGTGRIPAAGAALALLPYVAALDDSVWWEQQGRVDWSSTTAKIELAAQQPFDLSQEDLDQRAASASAKLLEECSEETLTEVYSALLSRHRPIVLGTRQAPLSPLALAALMMPLRREDADDLSLAAWIPSSRYGLDELADHWDVLVTRGPGRPPPPRDRISSQIAEQIVAALVSGDPDPLRAAYGLDTKRSAASTAVPPPPMTFAAPTSGLGPLPPDAHPLLRSLHSFADRTDHRWFSVAALRERFGGDVHPLEREDHARLLRGWVDEVDCRRPKEADEEQWRVKVDLLCAAAIAFAPGSVPRRTRTVWSGRVPPLFFLPSLSPDSVGRLTVWSPEVFAGLLEQSRQCRQRRFVLPIEQWLRGVTDQPNCPEWLLQLVRQSSAESDLTSTTQPNEGPRPSGPDAERIRSTAPTGSNSAS